ncbi:MAG: exosome complex protein Rrp42 [Candidatus Pacearchaeota archaeon]
MIPTSNNTSKRIAEYLATGKRFDKRKNDEFRDIHIECGISKKAEGSAKVKLGKTEVWVGVKLGIGEPYPDSQEEGNMMVTCELTPLSSEKYDYGPPKFNSIELGRLVDRGIRESKYIDFKKLCIKEGEKVWTVFIDIYSVNDNGNLLDAAFIATLAALKSAKIPFYDEETEKIDYDKPHVGAIPLTKNIPFNFSVYKIKNSLILDPNTEEEEASDGRLVLAVIPGNPIKICSMQKGEENVINEEGFSKMLDLVESKYKDIFPKVEKLIDEAIQNS